MSPIGRKAPETSPISLDTHAGYAAARARHTQLSEELSALQVEQTELQRRSRESASDPSGALERAAVALVAGAAEDESRLEVNRRLHQLAERIPVVSRAVEMAARQVAAQKLEASRAVCERVAGTHRTIFSNMATAVFALVEAASEEAAFRAELRAAGVDHEPFIPSVPFRLGGGPAHDNAVARWTRAALDRGLIAHSDLPAELRDLFPASQHAA